MENRAKNIKQVLAVMTLAFVAINASLSLAFPGDRRDPRRGGGDRWSNPIHIISASYGANVNRGLEGNATNDVQRVCESLESCTYYVNVGTLGDPAYGHLKDFMVRYMCGTDNRQRSAYLPGEAHGHSLTINCQEARPMPPPPPPPPPRPQPRPERPGGIEVLSASYGSNVDSRLYNNAYNDVARSCNGQLVCNYRVSVTVLGDPAYGRMKDFVVRYRCQNRGGIERQAYLNAEANNQTAQLSCY